MPAPFAEILIRWHYFYGLIGAASATLIGLMFVAASIGTGIFTPDRRVALQSFLSPTAVHFTIVQITCLIAGAPDEKLKVIWNFTCYHRSRRDRVLNLDLAQDGQARYSRFDRCV